MSASLHPKQIHMTEVPSPTPCSCQRFLHSTSHCPTGLHLSPVNTSMCPFNSQSDLGVQPESFCSIIQTYWVNIAESNTGKLLCRSEAPDESLRSDSSLCHIFYSSALTLTQRRPDFHHRLPDRQVTEKSAETKVHHRAGPAPVKTEMKVESVIVPGRHSPTSERS